MVDQQTQLPLRSVESGDRQLGFAQGGASDDERVDRIALPNERAPSRAFAISLSGPRAAQPQTPAARGVPWLRARRRRIHAPPRPPLRILIPNRGTSDRLRVIE